MAYEYFRNNFKVEAIYTYFHVIRKKVEHTLGRKKKKEKKEKLV